MTATTTTLRRGGGIARRAVHRIVAPGYHDSLTIWVVLGLLVVVVSALVPDFLNPDNIGNVLVQLVPLGLASLGQLVVMLGGGIDLSIGPLISLTTIVLSHTANDSPQGIAFAIAVCLAIGALVGLVNGILAHHGRIPPLIVTLCTGFIVQGIAFAFHETSGGYVPFSLSEPLTGTIGPVPVPVLLYGAGIVVTAVLLYRLRFGRWLYALGGNEDVLFAAGVRVDRVRIESYVYAGVLAAVAGIFLASRLGSGSSRYGDTYALATIAAVVVGGVSIAGGRGALWGAIAGAAIVSMLDNVMNNISFSFGVESSFYKDVMIGLILIGAMLFYRNRR